MRVLIIKMSLVFPLLIFPYLFSDIKVKGKKPETRHSSGGQDGYVVIVDKIIFNFSYCLIRIPSKGYNFCILKNVSS